MKRWIPILAAVVLSGAYAVGQTIVTANQGKPGTQGPWPVTVVGGGGGSGGGPVTPQICTSTTHKVTSVGTSAASCPSTQLASRRFIVLCNSIENAASSLVKVRVDGVAPVIGTATAGDVLDKGDCALYAIAAGTVPSCIANGTGVAVTSYECL